MRFSRDRRGQSVVIGTVILFGFLILALSLYQVQIVPQQNAQVEFQHFEEVRNDLVELRAGILQAGSTDRPQYQTVRLGTSYSTRLFAINPPAPAGTIRTVEAPPITIAYASNNTVIDTIPTRFVQYRPGYNEIDQSPTWYDASVLYVDARDEGGGVAVIEDQELVDSDGRVRIVALQNEFRRSGTGRVTLELRPAENVTGTIPEGDLNITVPTRLSGEEYWNGTDIPNDVYGGVSAPDDDGVHNLTLETTANNLTVDTVGVQEAPENPNQNDNAAVGGGADDGGGGGGGGGGGDALPADSVAYDDFDDDGQYDSGETPYTAEQIEDFDDQSVNLVIARDVRRPRYDISAGSITVDPDVSMENNGEDVTLTASDSGSVQIRGTVDATTGGDRSITVEGGVIDLNSGSLLSGGSISVESIAGGLEMDGTTVDTTTGSGRSVTITSAGAISGVDAQILSSGKVSMSSSNSNSIILDDALIDVTDGNDRSVTLTTTDELSMNRIRIVGDASGELTGNRGNPGRNVFVDDAVFEANNGDAKEFNIKPGTRSGGPNGDKNPPPNVQGTPQKGQVV